MKFHLQNNEIKSYLQNTNTGASYSLSVIANAVKQSHNFQHSYLNLLHHIS